ncbi:NAD(P)-dependent alcohol dehydrogenase [Agromyces sp. NPDC049794]|uniref:NAD(P)-dependent alcohol dehydrogenase n=1 Tax=unclassified Agromyces TaxID=2639701 RepID=UPI00340973DD
MSDTRVKTGTRMRAAVARRFGGPEVVHVEEVPKPETRADELLIRVQASTVSVADHRTRARDLPKGLWFYIPISLGVFRPRHAVLGMDAAGTVEAVGAHVTRFAPGDEVMVMLGGAFGGHAEYVTVKQDAAIAPKPRNLSMEEAAAIVFGGHTALAFLGMAEIVPGAEVLVNGASGAVGTMAVQLAKHRGARVTAVCSGRNADLVTSLGADRVVDHTVQDFAAEGRRYDVIVDCVGNAPFERVERALAPGGSLLLVITDLKGALSASRHSKRSGRLVTARGAIIGSAEFGELAALAEAGEVRPVIDRTYDLDDIVEAHRYVDTGRKRGSVVLRIA